MSITRRDFLQTSAAAAVGLMGGSKVLAEVPRARKRPPGRPSPQSIKPIDDIYVGMYPRRFDEVKMNAEIVHKILTAA